MRDATGERIAPRISRSTHRARYDVGHVLDRNTGAAEMIIRPKLNWFRLLFVWCGSVLPQLLPRLGLIFALSLLAIFMHDHMRQYPIGLGTPPFALVGIALAVFLGFRNSASYERWWEGRKLWGALLNASRSLARQALSHAEAPDRAQSRRFLASLDGYALMSMQHNLNTLSDVIGGCERIAATPLPFSYSVMIHRTIYLFCVLLPFGLVDGADLLTPLFSLLVAYAFMALEAIAAQIEDPFGMEENDLALNAICATIETALHDMAADPAFENAPRPAPPARDYLLD